jgi:ribosomal protein L37AE/L43A
MSEPIKANCLVCGGEYKWSHAIDCWQCHDCGEQVGGSTRVKIETMQAVIAKLPVDRDGTPIIAGSSNGRRT